MASRPTDAPICPLPMNPMVVMVVAPRFRVTLRAPTGGQLFLRGCHHPNSCRDWSGGNHPKGWSPTARPGWSNPDMDSSIRSQLESFRQARREIEASVLPLATSVDGRWFSFQASLHDRRLALGGCVVLDGDGDGAPRLGQILALELDRQPVGELTLPPSPGGAPGAQTELQLRYARGEGVIIDGELRPFHDALIRVATDAEVRAWQQSSAPPRAMLRLGDLDLVPGVPALADSGGFNRHTFLCGQSGAGKTYSLGVILEQLLTETELRIIILDPNSDFVRLGQPRPDADPARAARYQQVAGAIAVWSAQATGERRLRLHAAEVDPATQAASLRLDPIADRDEYAALAAFLAGEGTPT